MNYEPKKQPEKCGSQCIGEGHSLRFRISISWEAKENIEEVPTPLMEQPTKNLKRNQDRTRRSW